MTSNQVATEQVLAAETARRKALMAADTERLGDILADEYTYVHGSGRTESKEAYIASIGSGTFRFTDFSSGDMAVNVYGQAALVAGEISVTREEAGNRKVIPFRFAAVWAKSGTDWRLVHWQNTKL